jgi:hypothetical protein
MNCMKRATTVGFSVAADDQPRLERLTDVFADGNRSEFLRIAIHQMEVIDRAQRLAELQAYGASMAEQAGLDSEDPLVVVRRALGTNA